MTAVALVVAALFAVVAGSNDGASLMSLGAKVGGLRPVTMVAVLVSALAAGPLVFGTRVASTLALQLSPLARGGGAGVGGRSEVLVAVLTAMAVVFLLNRRGLPTSSTLAIIGAITGAALGAGAPVDAVAVVGVLGLGLLAPVLSGLLALGLARVLNRRARSQRLHTRLSQAHASAFVAQSLAYSANGGQKILAVFALAIGTTAGRSVHAPVQVLVAMAVLFGAGTLLGLRRVSRGLASDVSGVHLRHAVSAEACTAVVTFASALAGVPLTTSQSIGGALIGAASAEGGIGRVRLPAVARLGGAWLLTLPASLVLAASATAALGLR